MLIRVLLNLRTGRQLVPFVQAGNLYRKLMAKNKFFHHTDNNRWQGALGWIQFRRFRGSSSREVANLHW
jgi:hypothetical protein